MLGKTIEGFMFPEMDLRAVRHVFVSELVGTHRMKHSRRRRILPNLVIDSDRDTISVVLERLAGIRRPQRAYRMNGHFGPKDCTEINFKLRRVQFCHEVSRGRRPTESTRVLTSVWARNLRH